MQKKASPHLHNLKALIEDADSGQIFSCIQDLVSNGLTLSRFPDGESRPTRQDVTQFVAAWFRHIGGSPDACRDWLIEYCVDVLSPISSSSKSQIRHSTRSNIKYIYRSEVPFDCGCENNLFRAACRKECPLYEEMRVRYIKRKEREANRSYEPEPPAKDHGVGIVRPAVKELNREQFEKGLTFIAERLRRGVARKKIVALLNDGGFKTRTGKNWTYSVLNLEIHKNNLNT